MYVKSTLDRFYINEKIYLPEVKERIIDCIKNRTNFAYEFASEMKVIKFSVNGETVLCKDISSETENLTAFEALGKKTAISYIDKNDFNLPIGLGDVYIYYLFEGMIFCNERKEVFFCNYTYETSDGFIQKYEPLKNLSDYKWRYHSRKTFCRTTDTHNIIDLDNCYVLDGGIYEKVPEGCFYCKYHSAFETKDRLHAYIGDSTSVGICEDAKRMVKECPICGKTYFVSDMVVLDDETVLCNKCIHNGDYIQCETCGKWHKRGEKCKFCRYMIHCYHDSHSTERIFYKKPEETTEQLFIGFESEFVFPSDTDRLEFIKQVKDYGEAPDFFMERDGSLPYHSVEMISEPMTIEYIRTSEAVKNAFDAAEKNNAFKRSQYCGLHFHISKDALSPDAIDNLLFIYNTRVASMKKVCHRDNVSYCEPYGGTFSNVKARIKNRNIRGFRGHSVAVNLSNDHTVEIRLFGGVSSYDEFMGAFETMVHILNKCRSYSFDTFTSISLNKLFNDASEIVKNYIRG